MEAEILASGRQASEERGSLDRILAISNRRRTDYRAFLRRFAVLRELTTIDPDSFDYGFYNYGLQVYGNMPLIEENEYREANRIRTLVIAIDTSASCQETLVQRFVNETAAVLESIAGFYETFEVHILECDEHVQGERVLHSTGELERYAQDFHVRGGFGTDFRPVFARVEEMRKTGEIRDLAGLMYFTDGMGVYPEKPTDYDTAFVFFKDDELDDSKVPDWALRLYLMDGKNTVVPDRPFPAGKAAEEKRS
jgi:predicted metal-dependent peptidase